MLLCQVSSLWRSIALNTPSLWIYLNYVGYVTNQDIFSGKIPVSMVWNEFLETGFLKWWAANLRSENATIRLNVCLDLSRRERRDQNIDSDAFERAILNARGLYLEHGIMFCFCKRFEEQPLNAQHLRSIFVKENGNSGRNFNGSKDLDSMPIHFSNNFRCFVRHGYRFRFPLIRQIQDRIPWQAVTHVSIRTLVVTPTEWHTLIRRFSFLQVGEFHVQRFFQSPEQSPFDFDTSQSHVSLADVKSLNLYIKDYSRDFNPLKNLSLPNVTRLAIYLTGPTLDAVRAITQSCPRLEDLCLEFLEICLDSPPNISTSRLWDSVPELRSFTVDVDPLIYSLRGESALHEMEKWIEELSLAWLDLPHAPISFRHLVFTASKRTNDLLGSTLRPGIQARCALLGLPPRVEVDFRRSEEGWNFSPTEILSWM